MLNDLLVVGADHSDQEVEHDDGDDKGANNVENPHQCLHGAVIELLSVTAQSNFVGLLEEVEEVLIAVWRSDQERDGEAGQQKEVDCEEHHASFDHLEERVDEVTSFVPHPQEVEYLQPHEKADKGLQRIANLGFTLAFNSCHVHDHDDEDECGRDQVNEIP